MRRTQRITISAENRDKGKTFVLTEMSALRAEKWANRALVLLSKGAGSAIMESITPDSGWTGIIAVGLEAIGNIEWSKLEPLMDEMLGCIAVCSNPAAPEIVRPLFSGGSSDDIEEQATLLLLRRAVLELHLGFPLADGLSKLDSLIPRATSQNTKTSPEPSAQ
jgi:hypothetical protein